VAVKPNQATKSVRFHRKHFGSLNAVMKATEEELLEVEEVGHRIAQSIHEFFAETSNRDLVKRLEAAGLQFKGVKKERGTVMTANDGHWRLVAHGDEATFGAPVMRAELALLGGAAIVLLAIIGALAVVSRSIEHRITSPAAALAELAEAVAAGDLSRRVDHTDAEDEIGRLSRAVAAMVAELRRLAGALGSSAQETSAMSAEITAGTEEMAASAGEIAHTASELSQKPAGPCADVEHRVLASCGEEVDCGGESRSLERQLPVIEAGGTAPLHRTSFVEPRARARRDHSKPLLAWPDHYAP